MEYNSPEFRKWLDKLQQESWQLELIISGFVIYGLIMAIDPVDLKSEMASNNGNAFGFVWVIISIALYILLFNLVFHVLLRGLWIGAIGLRYVSGDIDYDHLSYSPKFTSFLKRKVGSFDRYIAQLENYCSIMFAVSFLLIFYILGALLVLFILGSAVALITLTENLGKPVIFIVLFLLVILYLTAVIVFIDFIGQGFLKRKKWTSKIYYPIYRVYGILTLSFLYRPLVYNFLDNKFGKRMSILLIPIYVAIVSISTIEYHRSNYLMAEKDSSEFYSKNSHYENLSTKESDFIEVASIPSKVIETSYLRVFILFQERMEDYIFETNQSLKPKDDNRGFYSSMVSEFNRGIKDAQGKIDSVNIETYLKTTNQLYNLKIDSIDYESDFWVATNAKGRIGFETYLNIRNLTEGKHILNITGPTKEDIIDEKSKTIEKNLVTIPFLYFPENRTGIIREEKIKSDSITNK